MEDKEDTGYEETSTFLQNLVVYLILLIVIACAFFFVIIPSFLSFIVQTLKPIKHGWESLNIILVIFAIVCGFFSRDNNEKIKKDQEARAKNGTSQDAQPNRHGTLDPNSRFPSSNLYHQVEQTGHGGSRSVDYFATNDQFVQQPKRKAYPRKRDISPYDYFVPPVNTRAVNDIKKDKRRRSRSVDYSLDDDEDMYRSTVQLRHKLESRPMGSNEHKVEKDMKKNKSKDDDPLFEMEDFPQQRATTESGTSQDAQPNRHGTLNPNSRFPSSNLYHQVEQTGHGGSRSVDYFATNDQFVQQPKRKAYPRKRDISPYDYFVPPVNTRAVNDIKKDKRRRSRSVDYSLDDDEDMYRSTVQPRHKLESRPIGSNEHKVEKDMKKNKSKVDDPLFKMEDFRQQRATTESTSKKTKIKKKEHPKTERKKLYVYLKQHSPVSLTYTRRKGKHIPQQEISSGSRNESSSMLQPPPEPPFEVPPMQFVLENGLVRVRSVRDTSDEGASSSSDVNVKFEKFIQKGRERMVMERLNSLREAEGKGNATETDRNAELRNERQAKRGIVLRESSPKKAKGKAVLVSRASDTESDDEEAGPSHA